MTEILYRIKAQSPSIFIKNRCTRFFGISALYTERRVLVKCCNQISHQLSRNVNRDSVEHTVHCSAEGTCPSFAQSFSPDFLFPLRMRLDRMQFPQNPILRAMAMKPIPTTVWGLSIICRMDGNSQRFPKRRQAKPTKKPCSR